MSAPYISICIPAYKRVDYLRRLLDSIVVQKFRDFEVVISDDSDDNSVKDLVNEYNSHFEIKYFHNEVAMGTPENWNCAIRKASGKWIKIMHDDDWFANDQALQVLNDATIYNPDYLFFFSSYYNVSGEVSQLVKLNRFHQYLLRKNPLNLFKYNMIGNPSCTLVSREVNILYDKRFKWVVDFEFYMRFLNRFKKAFYIDKPLIKVGIHDQQVTSYTFRKPEVEIPENHLMVENIGPQMLRNIFVYDYYWRLYRNLNVRQMTDVTAYHQNPIHPLLQQMIASQNKYPISWLRKGWISKPIMLYNYCKSWFKKL